MTALKLFVFFAHSRLTIAIPLVPSSKMFVIQEIASALIAGAIVVVLEWKRLLGELKAGEFFYFLKPKVR